MNYGEEKSKVFKSEKEYREFLVTFVFWMNQSSYDWVQS